MRPKPQRSSYHGRINSDFAPPFSFVATQVDFAVMAAAQRDNKFVTDLAPKCPALGKSHVVRI
jgi:hypothetical protein